MQQELIHFDLGGAPRFFDAPGLDVSREVERRPDVVRRLRAAVSLAEDLGQRGGGRRRRLREQDDATGEQR